MATNGNFVCRSGLGQARYYASLPGASDALILLFLQPVSQQDDDVLRDYDTVAAVLGGGNKECTAPGYVRKSITSGTTSTPDNTNNRVDVDVPDTTWTALGAMTGTNSKQDQAAVLICYQPNTSTGSDSTLLVLSKHYYPFVADGSDRIVPFPNGFYRAAG